jgi:hypothetical protein
MPQVFSHKPIGLTRQLPRAETQGIGAPGRESDRVGRTDIREGCALRHIEALSDKRLAVEDRLRQSPIPSNPTEPDSQ